ncbi:MAG: hypothetical protein CMM25_05175 [Rhodospirillaceae bacterium]|nr:hypothetical protein [Rhodospirillaceae bacterium]
MVPVRFSHILYCSLLSLFMTFVVSGVSTLSAIGISEDFGLSWMTAWYRSWLIAFPAILILAPITRKLVDNLTLES